MQVPDLPKRVQIGVQEGYCNLRCPSCFVHNNGNYRKGRVIKGLMPLKDVSRILDQISPAMPAVTPNLWSEPLMIKDFCLYITAIKKRGLSLVINTNGLLLTPKTAEFLVKIRADSVFISIDAMTSKTLKKVRGISGLDKIKEAVFTLTEARGHNSFPRVGVSFNINKYNLHEKQDFISYWLKHVDVIRVNETFQANRGVNGVTIPKKRVPCQALFDTMAINYKGDVLACCLDVFYKTNLGNVLRDGVRKVWHSQKFQELRHFHEVGQYDKVPFCKNCDVWSEYLVRETIKDNILIRESPVMTHYNRIDRLNTWKAGRCA